VTAFFVRQCNSDGVFVFADKSAVLTAGLADESLTPSGLRERLRAGPRFLTDIGITDQP
jgi:hypothetical protein